MESLVKNARKDQLEDAMAVIQAAAHTEELVRLVRELPAANIALAIQLMMGMRARRRCGKHENSTSTDTV